MNKIIVISFAIFGFTFSNSLFGQTEIFCKDSLLSDVDILFLSIEEIHPNMYATLSRENFNKKLALIKSEIKAEMNVFEFYKLERLPYRFTPLLFVLQQAEEFQIDYSYNGAEQKILVKGIPYSERFERKSQKGNKKKYKSYYNKKIILRRNGIKTINKKSRLIRLRKNNLRYHGNVFLLISHTTFSSAASFSWAFKYFEMGTVIGEECGGMAVCFGDIIRQRLPYSKLNYGVSYKKFNLYGATDENNHGTIPDYEVQSENALDFTIEFIQKQR